MVSPRSFVFCISCKHYDEEIKYGKNRSECCSHMEILKKKGNIFVADIVAWISYIIIQYLVMKESIKKNECD